MNCQMTDYPSTDCLNAAPEVTLDDFRNWLIREAA